MAEYNIENTQRSDHASSGHLREVKRLTPHAFNMVAVTYRRWSFTRGSNCKALTGKILVFWIVTYGCLPEVITHEGSLEIFFGGCKLNSPYNSKHLGTEKNTSSVSLSPD